MSSALNADGALVGARNYPRNCWWVAARQQEVGRQPLSRWLLDRPVVLYRTEANDVVALDDRCIHRWAPISSGYVAGDHLICGYHGAVYAPDGKCVRYPTQPSVPAIARVASYPVVERTPFVWIWLGDPEQMRAASEPPAFDWFVDPNWVVADGAVTLSANYFLLHENVLDLTHFNYLHRKTLQITDRQPPTFRRDGDQVSFYLLQDPYRPPPWQGGLDPQHALRSEARATFVTPALHISDTVTTDLEAGEGEQAVTHFRVIHCVTPESPVKTHYWWLVGQDFGQGPGAADALRRVTGAAAEEDKAILENIQEILAKDERGMNAREVSFVGDTGGMQARRVLKELLAREVKAARAEAPAGAPSGPDLESGHP